MIEKPDALEDLLIRQGVDYAHAKRIMRVIKNSQWLRDEREVAIRNFCTIMGIPHTGGK